MNLKLVAAMSLCAAARLLAQAGGYAEISGTVRDTSGAVVPGAQVLVSNPSKGVHFPLTTTDGGVFDAPSLIPASGYQVSVTKEGFAEYAVKNIELPVGRNMNLAVVLTVGSTSTQISVEATAPLLDDTKSDVSQVVDSNAIISLPINGRRVDSFVLLTPAVTQDGNYGLLSFRGVANGNTFLVDGNDTTDQFWVENAGRTRTVSQLSQDAVQEFEVVSSNFSAEYGKAAGGVVNAVTRSGSNTLHGTGFWFFRNQDLEALDTFTPAGVFPKDTRNQRGFSLGGPIKRDKLFFFVNGDFTNKNFPLQSSIIKAGVVDTQNQVWLTCNTDSSGGKEAATPAQCNAINSLLPRFFGTLPRTVTSDIGFARMDYHLSERNTLSASFNYMHWLAPNGIQTGSVVTTGGAISSNGNSVARVREGRVAWTAVPNSNFVNEFRFGWLNDRQSDDINPALTGSGLGNLYLSVQAQQIGSVYYLPRVEPNEYRYQFADNVSWVHGKHSVKFGADFARTSDYTYFIQYANGNYTYQTVTKFAEDYSDPNSASVGLPGKHWQSYSQTVGNPVTNTTIGDYNFYLQDQWRLAPKLTFNYGARYEYSHLPQPEKCNPDYPQTCHINSPKNDFMPRVGLAYKLNDKTVVRAGYGMFYSRVAAATLQDLFSGNGVNTVQFSLNSTSTTQLGAGPVFPNVLASVPTGAGVSASSIQFTDPNWRIPYSEQGTLALERQLSHDVSLTASYIWSRGVQLYGERDLNLPPVSATTKTYSIVDATGNQTGSFATPIYMQYSPTQARPDGRYGAVVQDENGVTSSYNALVLQARKRFSHGLQADLAYTWSHEIDDGQGYGQQSQNIFMSSASSWLHNGNYKADKGNGLEDQRQRFVFSWVWAPTFTHRTGAFYKYVVNNWQLSSITSLNSARPYGNATIKVNDTPVAGIFSSFTIDGSGLSSRAPFLPANAIWQPASYRDDARLSKLLRFSERYSLALNFEVFNVSNSWSPTAINNQQYTEAKGVLTLTPGAYGVGTGDQLFPDGTEARRMQLSARFTF